MSNRGAPTETGDDANAVHLRVPCLRTLQAAQFVGMATKKAAESERPTVGELKDKLRQLGLRSTGARLAVYRALDAAQRPLSHGEVTEQLEDLGFDAATLFRNLNDLVEVGIVTRTDMGDHVWRFELRKDGKAHAERHPHFLCTACGELSCLPEAAVSVKRVPGAPKTITEAPAIQVQGRCDDCSRREVRP